MCGRNCFCSIPALFQDLYSDLWAWMQICLEKCDNELACKEVKLRQAGIAAHFFEEISVVPCAEQTDLLLGVFS